MKNLKGKALTSDAIHLLAGKLVADDPGYRWSLSPEYHPDYRVVHLQRLVLGMGGITSELPFDSLSTVSYQLKNYPICALLFTADLGTPDDLQGHPADRYRWRYQRLRSDLRYPRGCVDGDDVGGDSVRRGGAGHAELVRVQGDGVADLSRSVDIPRIYFA